MKHPVVHVDDAAERAKRRIGRPSQVENFRKLVVEILQEKADLPSVEVLRRVRQTGYAGGKSAFYGLVASLRPKEEVFSAAYVESFLQRALVFQEAVP